MRFEFGLVLLLVAGCKTTPGVPVDTALSSRVTPMPAQLLGPEEFDRIKDVAARSRALFTEAGKVLSHPRCTNCHPAGDTPRQGNVERIHEPPVTRGADGHGVFLNACHSCHPDHNGVDGPIPGAPAWHLAPIQMAWKGVPLPKLCAQLKDSARNGNRTLDQIVEHAGKDPLVRWAWDPGSGRAPAPGTQERFGALLAAWAASGAVCPD